MKLSKTQKAVLALTFANIIWGAAPPIFKWSLATTPLFTLGFLRFIIPCILILLLRKQSLKIKPKDWHLVFLTGFGMITCNILFFFLGLKLTNSINATMIGSSGPLFLMLGSFLLLREKIKPKTIIGNLLGFLGVFIIVFQPLFLNRNDSFIGNIYFILSTLGIVGGTIYGKKIIKRYDPIVLTFWSLFTGAVTFFPFFVHEVGQYGFLPNIDIPTITGIVFGVFLSSLLAYYLLFVSLKYFPASETGIFMYIDPVVTFFIAIPLLHEIPTPAFVFGSILIFVGIYIVEGRIHYHPLYKLFERD